MVLVTEKSEGIATFTLNRPQALNALNEALISAQQMRADTKEQATREAELIVREAQADADRIVTEARASTARLRAEIDALDRARRGFLAQMRAMTERQLAELQADRKSVV